MKGLTLVVSGVLPDSAEQFHCDNEFELFEKIREQIHQRLIFDPNARVITLSVVDNTKFKE